MAAIKAAETLCSAQYPSFFCFWGENSLFVTPFRKFCTLRVSALLKLKWLQLKHVVPRTVQVPANPTLGLGAAQRQGRVRFKFLRLRPGQSCRRAVVTGRLLSFLLRSAIICACGHHACSELRNFQLSQSTKGRRRRTRALREGSRSKAGAAGRRLLHRLRRRMISGVQHSAPKIRFARRRIPYRIDVYCTWDGRQ